MWCLIREKEPGTVAGATGSRQYPHHCRHRRPIECCKSLDQSLGQGTYRWELYIRTRYAMGDGLYVRGEKDRRDVDVLLRPSIVSARCFCPAVARGPWRGAEQRVHLFWVMALSSTHCPQLIADHLINMEAVERGEGNRPSICRLSSRRVGWRGGGVG